MKRYLAFAVIAAVLVASSAAMYTVHYLLFHDAHHIFLYLVGDIAFVPIEVLLVAIVIERLLARHERRRLLHKMNMVIGTFFSELGTRLLADMTACLENRDEVLPALAVTARWQAADYKKALARAAAIEYRFQMDRLDLEAIGRALAGQRSLLVMLLANPTLLEHEQFTDLLWAVFHLMEELEARPSLAGLPDTDREHLAGDARRVYGRLAAEWLRHCRHLQKAYPYMFSIVLRTHPFQDHPSAVVA